MCFSDDYKSAKHVVGRTYKDLQAIMGSKYFQSDTAGIYKRVLELLKEMKEYYFVEHLVRLRRFEHI